mmetsp:Transcript_105642/g.215416  ORF Transcript_105642/g.215416 Transcript_105642/m.215416 type:complete len:226 (+) Transcript_105642:1932-2609(+)
MISVPTSEVLCPTPASVMRSRSFRAASRLASSPSIFASGAAMFSPTTCTQSSSLPLIFSSNSCTAATSIDPFIFRAISRTKSGALVCSAFDLGAAGFAASVFAAGFFSSFAFAGAFSATAGAAGATALKRCFRRCIAISDSAPVSFDISFGAPAAASARRSSGHSSGRGVKSTHLPSGSRFHQNLSATKPVLTGLSRCSKMAHPCMTCIPVAFSTRSAFEKLWSW